MSNDSLHHRRAAAMAQGQGALHPIYVEKAFNAEIWDIEGNRLIDLGAGIAVNNTGHNHPRIKAAVQSQIERFSHTCLMVTASNGRPWRIANQLCSRACRAGCHPGGAAVRTALHIGERITARLRQLQSRFPQRIGDVRNLGAMIALELVVDGDVNQPDPELTKALVTEASQNGLILLSCGIRNNVIRFLPALTITDPLIDESMDILDSCFSALNGSSVRV